MARPLRVEFKGAWYHVMNRGAGRRCIFSSAAHFSKFLRLVAEVSEVFALEVHAYCLMGNHYHLLVRTPEAGLGRAMRHLNGVYTQYFNKRNRTDGALFRGRYKAILVASDSHLLMASRYIHLNPVDAGFVNRPEAYAHSSYRGYVEPHAARHWLFTSTLLGQFMVGDPRVEYRRFVGRGVDAATQAFHSASRLKPIFGGETFERSIRSRVERMRANADPEIPEVRRLETRPSLNAIGEAVAATFGVDLEAMRDQRHERAPDLIRARWAALYIGRHEAGASLASMAQWLGYRSYNSAASALSRLRRKMKDPELAVRLSRARSMLHKDET